MKIRILDRESMEERAERPFPAKTAVISITDAGDAPVKLAHLPEHLLRLSFDDVEPEPELPDKAMGRINAFDMRNHIISDQQAGEIAGFVHAILSGADLLICQCEYGQSRSAAVAAAIAEYAYGCGIDIFADDRYFPNKYVFRKVLGALKEQRHIPE